MAGLHSLSAGSYQLDYAPYPVRSTACVRVRGAAPISQELGLLVPNYQFIIVLKLPAVSSAGRPGAREKPRPVAGVRRHSRMADAYSTCCFSVRKRSSEHGGVDSTSCQTVAGAPNRAWHVEGRACHLSILPSR